MNYSFLDLIILDKLESEFWLKTMFICKTHNLALKIRNVKLIDLFKVIENKHELFNTISTHFRGNETPFC